MIRRQSSNRIVIKIISLFSAIIFSLLTTSFIKAQDTTNSIIAVELVRMNVFYIGVDNPIKIAASGYKSTELEVSIDNGTITGSNGVYIIRPKSIGDLILTVKCRGKVIQKSNFRVKGGAINHIIILQGDSVSFYYDYKKNCTISKKDFLNVKEIKVVAKNSDFDVNIEICKFTLSIKTNDSIIEATSNGNKFTNEQKAIIKENAIINSKIYIDNIFAKMTDESVRKLGSMKLNIIEE